MQAFVVSFAALLVGDALAESHFVSSTLWG